MYTKNAAFVEMYFENLSYQSLNETAALTASFKEFNLNIGLDPNSFVQYWRDGWTLAGKQKLPTSSVIF